MVMAAKIKSTKAIKSAHVRSQPDGDASAIFMALLEAERWLFAAGEAAGLQGTAIARIRRQVCAELERLQPNAYRAFDDQVLARRSGGAPSPWA